MQNFSIKELESFSGIKAHTFRVWESRYKILQPQRSKTNFRYYTLSDVKETLQIALLLNNGYRISKVAQLDSKERETILNDLKESQIRVEKSIHKLLLFLAELDIDNFEHEIDNSMLALGTRTVIIDILFPFLQRSEILWRAQQYNSIYQHFSQNIIRQKIIKGIENSFTSVKTNKTALLFLPEGQFNEIPLLSLYYLLKEKGYAVIYLGANLSVSNLKKVIEIKNPQIACTFSENNKKEKELMNFLKDSVKKQVENIYVISDNQKQNEVHKKESNIKFMKTAVEAFNHMQDIN